MRDLVFKNMVSGEKRRRIICTSEIVEKEGLTSIIHRHFVYMVKEVEDKKAARPSPYLYVLKEHNDKERKEKFFCRIKGSVNVIKDGKIFLILYMHSLKITFKPLAQDIIKNSGG